MTLTSTKCPHICIVDDNQMAREVITEQLSVENYRVTHVHNGLDLLKRFDQLNPDVILMDVMMPQVNGYAVCQEIKQNPARKHIPVILVTALNNREDMLQGLEAGADEFLTKPANGAELRARVRTMLVSEKSTFTNPGARTAPHPRLPGRTARFDDDTGTRAKAAGFRY
jgi:DNA-binding response OmpR family regulator